MILDIIIFIVSILVLVKGADFFIGGASGIAKYFKIPLIIIGLTIVAFGTSAPEAAVSISAAFQGSPGIAIGNVLGSNIFNILFILGLTSLIIPLTVQRNTAYLEIPFLINISIILVLIGYFTNNLSRISGIILWIIFIIFLSYNANYVIKHIKKRKIKSERSNLNDIKSLEKSVEEQKKNIFKYAIFTIAGFVAIVVSSHFAVNSASSIATEIGMSERLIGLTIVSVGTSLPELVTSAVAALKKNPDIAVGNIVGSNIFNILFILGTTAIIQPIPYGPEFLLDGLISIFAAVLLFLCVFGEQKISRHSGALMIVFYGAYLFSIIAPEIGINLFL